MKKSKNYSFEDIFKLEATEKISEIAYTPVRQPEAFHYFFRYLAQQRGRRDLSMISMAIEKMIDFYKGNTHDINHFLKVYGFAKTIGELEHLDADTQETLELAAVLHDIACPLCREKYGNAAGKLQEQESPALVEEFLSDLPVSKERISRVSWLVAHHHTLPDKVRPPRRGVDYGVPEGCTYTDVDELDHRILLEADYLVNADEGGQSEEAIRTALERIFMTESGKRLLCSMYRL